MTWYLPERSFRSSSIPFICRIGSADATAQSGASQDGRRRPDRHHTKLTITSLTNHAILVGYGRVGRLVAETLRNAGQPYLIVEERQVVADQLRAGGVDVISGNAAQPGLLEAANVNSAKWLISAIPNPFESGNFIEYARATNPKLEIIARAHSDAEVEYLKKLGANLIVMGEKEIARSISEHILSKINAPDTTIPSDSESRLTSE